MKKSRYKRKIIRYRVSKELVDYFVNEVKQKQKHKEWIKENTITPNVFLFGKEYPY